MQKLIQICEKAYHEKHEKYTNRSFFFVMSDFLISIFIFFFASPSIITWSTAAICW